VNSALDLPASFNGRVLSEAARHRWRAVLLLRVVLVGALLAMAFDADRLGDNADLLANALMFSVGPWHLLLLLLTLRDEAMPWYVSFADAAIIAATSTLVPPELWAPALLAGPAIVAVESAVAGRNWGVASSVFTVSAFAVAGTAVEVSYLPALLIALTLACVMTTLLIGQITHEHTHARVEQEALLDLVPALVWEADADGARFVRGRIRELLGFTRVEWAQLDSFIALIHPDDIGAMTQTGDLQPGDERVRDFRMRRRDGSWLWLRDSITVGADYRGRRVLHGVSRDISTERTRSTLPTGCARSSIGSLPRSTPCRSTRTVAPFVRSTPTIRAETLTSRIAVYWQPAGAPSTPVNRSSLSTAAMRCGRSAPCTSRSCSPGAATSRRHHPCTGIS